MELRETSGTQADLLEIVRRASLIASEGGMDQADATRLAAVSICHVRPDWPLHEALKFIWRHGEPRA
jgi:hypothetical protein